MSTVTNNPVTFTFTGNNGYTSTITYTYIPGDTSNIILSIDNQQQITPKTNITFTPTAVPNGQLNVAYATTTFTAIGGTGPYTFAVTNGTLPTGLELTTSGVLEGSIPSTPSSIAGQYTFTITATDNNGSTGSQTYTMSVLAAPVTPWSPPSPPTFPTVTADTQSFRYIRGISYVSPALYNLDLGVELTNTANQPLIVCLSGINSTPIPKGTSVTLYSGQTPLVTGYFTGKDNSGNPVTIHDMTLYYTPTTYNAEYTCIVNTDNNGTPWIPVMTLSATGTARIINGSLNAYVLGSQNGMGLFAGGNAANTYIRDIDALDLNGGIPIQGSDHFIYRLVNQGFDNPYYGALVPTDIGTPFGTEMGFLSAGGANSPLSAAVYNAVIQFDVAQALVQTTNRLELFTPYTFALTGQPVWVQTVVPYLGINQGLSGFRVDWGDGTINNINNAAAHASAAYFSHAYLAPSETPYTVSVTGYNADGIFIPFTKSTSAVAATLSAQFYIQSSFPEISLSDYTATLGTTPVLPYTKEQVEVGSNEWAVADNINAALTKLDDNFQYLNTISTTIKRTAQFELIQWLEDLIQYPTWNTFLSGSNTFVNTVSTNNFGVTPGSIQGFKSYKSPFSAPDYFNYITYTILSAHSLVEVRQNDFRNTKVLSLSAIVPDTLFFNAYSIDVSGSNFYLLASEKPNQASLGNGYVSLYRFNLDYNTGEATVINQIGGAPGGTINDNYYFSYGQYLESIPTEIKSYNNSVYVGDKGNNCIKVYNSGLTWQRTIYEQSLSAYSTSPFDVDANTGNVFVFGTLLAPNAPVITSVSTSANNDAEGTTHYSVTWNHDGNRLSTEYDNADYNFVVYGTPANGGGALSAVGYVLNPTLSAPQPTTGIELPLLTEYIFNDTVTYTSFVVQALGKNLEFNSDYSSNIPTPNKNVFPSPYKVFVFDTNSNLVNTLYTPEVPPTAKICKLLVEPTGVFFYVVTDSYIYKYTTTGLYVNRINNPSYELYALNEPIVTAFIDDRSYFYVATASRLFKYIDLPSTSSLFDIDTVSSFYNPLSSYTIGENELVQDWVYNKAINNVLENHEILAKSFNGKYVITLDKDNNLVSFTNRQLSSTDVINSLSAVESSFIHSNEIVSSAVINRALDTIYDMQQTILSAISPEIVTQPPTMAQNVLGLVTTATPWVVYRYVQPAPVLLSPLSAQSYNYLQGNIVTLTADVSSAMGPDALSYQWLQNGAAVAGASASVYSFTAELSSIGYYSISAVDNVGVAYSDKANIGVELESLFTFVSAAFVGGLYSSNHINGSLVLSDNAQPRYSNDYTANVELFNVPLTASLLITLQETHGSSPWYFANPVTINVSYNSSSIFTTYTSVSGAYSIPLSGVLVNTADTVGSDGYSNLYTGKFSITLSLGDISTSNQSVPQVVVAPSQGVMIDANFTNGMYGDGVLNSSKLKVYNITGTLPYAAVTNNSLGGYMVSNPYISHTWSIDGQSSPAAPFLNATPASHTSSTIQASRSTTGETETTLTYSRTVGTAPSVPYYTITTQTGVIAKGSGYVIGGGTYQAGTVVTVRSVGTYLDADSTKLPGESSSSPLIVTGAGCYDAGVYTAFNSGGILKLQQDPSSTSASICQIYVDGNKQVIAYFTAGA